MVMKSEPRDPLNGSGQTVPLPLEEQEAPSYRNTEGQRIRGRVSHMLEALCDRLYEREEPVKLALLSAIAGESIFLLGVPGIGKSLVARRLKYAFRDGKSFEYLMSKFSTPDEIFGPISIKKLKEEDKFERKTDQYLPGANVVFLDEIWKSGPAIQNALLTILNEKLYRNGDQEMHVDIKGIITASNELPPEGSGLEPLWDRFLIRYHMHGIQEQRSFLQMIVATEDVYEDTLETQGKLSHIEIDEWDASINQVELPPEVLNTIQVVRQKIEEYNSRSGTHKPIQIYDRRWKKIVRLLRTSAFLNGRSQVDLMDCFLMVHCLWHEPNQVEEIQDIVAETIRKHGYTMAVQMSMLRKEVEALAKEVDEETRIQRKMLVDRLALAHDGFVELLSQDKPFEGQYIKLDDYRQLSRNEWQVVSVYGDDLKPRNRLKARRGFDENVIDFEYNAESISLRLRTEKVEKIETIVKKPHRLLTKHWEERVKTLSSYVEQQLERTENEGPDELHHLTDNLFVPAPLSKIVRSNLEEVKQALVRFKLRLEKIQHAYTHFE